MPSTSRKILDQLTDLQASLEGFSFDYLSAEQALELKNTFDAFRDQLEGRIWSPQAIRSESAEHRPQKPGARDLAQPETPRPLSGDNAGEELPAEEASDDLIALSAMKYEHR